MIYELPTALQQILGLASSDAAKTEGSKTYFTSQIINDKLAQALEDNTATKDKLEAYMGQSGTAMDCLLYTSPSPRDSGLSRMPSSA